MLPLARRLRWATSMRKLSSSSVMFKQSDKLRKAQLVKIWNESGFRDNGDIVRTILAEALTLHDHSLTKDIAAKFTAFGLHSTQDKYLVIESFESSGDFVRAKEVFLSLSVEDGLAYIVDHIDSALSSELSLSALEVYQAALNSNESLIKNVLLGNCVLRLYEKVTGFSVAELDQAILLLNRVVEGGGSIHVRTFESLIAAANNAKLPSIAETLYSEFRKAHPESLVAGIETQRMCTMNQRRQFKECLAVYDSLVSNGITLNERLVCFAVEACIPRQYFESGIKILNKWHDQGGVMTWPICKSTMQLATSIDNFMHRRSAPLLFSSSTSPSIYQDGFLPRLNVSVDLHNNLKKPADVYANAKDSLKSLSSEQKEQLNRMTFDTPRGANPFMDYDDSTSSEKYDYKAEGSILTSPSKSSGAVADGTVAASGSGADDSPQRVQLDTREQRLDFFRQYLVRRVIGRILQAQQEGAQYRHESPVPEDLILMCAGQMVLQGELDQLLTMLQKDEGEGKLAPLVEAVFVVAPMQLMNQQQYWREFVGLIERMRSFQSELSVETRVAAITRCMLTLFSCNQMGRARRQFESLLPLFAVDEALLSVFAELIARGELKGVVRILHVLHDKKLVLNEKVLIGVLKSCGTLTEISTICNAWRNTSRPEFGDNSSGFIAKALPDELMHVASDELCLAFARILKYALKEEQEQFIQYLKLTFSFTSEQSFLLTTGRPEPQLFVKPQTDNRNKKRRRGPPAPRKRNDDDESDD